jgi:hypothetical protein
MPPFYIVQRVSLIAYSISKPLYIYDCYLAAGAGAAVNEINDEAISLQLCEKCQVTLDKLKRAALPPGAEAAVSTGEVKKSSDRVNRVLMFMDNYLTRRDVIICGLNAIVYFSQNGMFTLHYIHD